MPFDQNQLPAWNKEGVEPPQSLKDEGWQPSQKPPADYFNWFFNKTFKALQSLFASAQHKEEKGQPGGYAALDANGKVVNADGTYPGGVSTETFNAHLADYVKHPAFAVASGTANIYSVTLNPAPTEYTDGMAISVKINVDSTGPSTLNVNGLGAVPLKKSNGNDVTNLKANGVYTFRYNASTGNFILQGEGGEYGTATATDVLEGKTIGTDSGIVAGTMPNRGAVTITPTTTDQAIPAGYHNGSGVVKGDPNLVPDNILSGKSIFGVNGSLTPGKKFATGTFSTYAATYTVTGLTFTPSIVLVLPQITNQAPPWTVACILNGSMTKLTRAYNGSTLVSQTIRAIYTRDMNTTTLPNSQFTTTDDVDGNIIFTNGFKVYLTGNGSYQELCQWYAWE